MDQRVRPETALPSVSLVLETNNLAGADRAEEVRRLLALLGRLREQTLSLTSLREVVLTHGGLSEGEQAQLLERAGAPLRFVQVTEETGYYQAKNLGFLATTGAIVAFGDADCWPDPGWLAHLTAPFAADPSVGVVAGRTVYRETVLGVASTAVDFLSFPSPLGPGRVRNFYANNVAFRREVFAKHPYPAAADLHRGNCTLLGIELGQAGIGIVLADHARTMHPLPVGAGAHLRFRLRRGEDTAALTEPLLRAYLPAPLARWPLPRTAASLSILGVRFGAGLRALARERRGPRTALHAATVAGLTLADALGVLGKSAGVSLVGSRDEEAPLAGWEGANLPRAGAPGSPR